MIEINGSGPGDTHLPGPGITVGKIRVKSYKKLFGNYSAGRSIYCGDREINDR
jgi:hypothetical protein